MKRTNCSHDLPSLRGSIVGICCVECGGRWEDAGAIAVILPALQQANEQYLARLEALESAAVDIHGHIVCDGCGEWRKRSVGAAAAGQTSLLSVSGRSLCCGCLARARDNEDDELFGFRDNAHEREVMQAVGRFVNYWVKHKSARKEWLRLFPELAFYWRNLARVDNALGAPYKTSTEFGKWAADHPGEYRELCAAFEMRPDLVSPERTEAQVTK